MIRERAMPMKPDATLPPLGLFSVVIPALDEEASIASVVEQLHGELAANRIEHEIVVVDDGSTDRTWAILQDLARQIPELVAMRNDDLHGFGRAVVCGLDRMRGDAVAIMMADRADDPRDAVRYWQKLC